MKLYIFVYSVKPIGLGTMCHNQGKEIKDVLRDGLTRLWFNLFMEQWPVRKTYNIVSIQL